MSFFMFTAFCCILLLTISTEPAFLIALFRVNSGSAAVKVLSLNEGGLGVALSQKVSKKPLADPKCCSQSSDEKFRCNLLVSLARLLFSN